jgi:glycosyltransferase involved in cell wall biosynthesis
MAVDHALEQGMDYILYIDDDMVLPSDRKLFTELVNHDKDIIAPLFFHKGPPHAPLIFKRMIYGNEGCSYTTFDNILDYKKGLVEVDGVGFGCALVKTDVFRAVEKPYFIYGDTCGEDLYFCNKAITKGFKVYCDTTLQVGHIGNPTVSFEGTFLSNKDAAELFMKQKIEGDVERAEKMLSTNKDTDKKVSVIMTSYNRPEYIKNAIESVLHQTYPNFELLIMDDNSDKQVKDFIETFNDPRIKKYYSDVTEEDRYKKTRYSVLINKALEMADGDYITYITDDSWYYPARLETMVNYLNSNGAAICYGGQNIFLDNKKEKKFELIGDRKPTKVLSDLVYKADHCSVMHTKRVTDEFKWEESPKAWRHGDAYFFKEVAKKYKFYPIEEILDASIRHEKSIMHQLDMDGDLYNIDRSKIEIPKPD